MCKNTDIEKFLNSVRKCYNRGVELASQPIKSTACNGHVLTYITGCNPADHVEKFQMKDIPVKEKNYPRSY